MEIVWYSFCGAIGDLVNIVRAWRLAYGPGSLPLTLKADADVDDLTLIIRIQEVRSCLSRPSSAPGL